MRSKEPSERVVYSTEQGRICPECCNPISACRCRQKGSPLVFAGIAKVSKETKGRNGKCVTLVSGLTLDPSSLIQLGKTLKMVCGSGGTIKEGVIEIQGDHVEQVTEQLQKQALIHKR